MKYSYLISLLIFVSITNNAIVACSCGGVSSYPLSEMDLLLSTSENYKKPLVFDGRLISMSVDDTESQTPKAILLFEVTRYYVGSDKDTIEVSTNLYSEACGFTTPLNSYAIIFANKNKDGKYTTSRSDCCKSTSQQFEKARYDAFKHFFEVLIDKKDGDYIFKNVFHRFSQFHAPDSVRNQEILFFSVKNGQLHGAWKVTDFRGKLIEQGFYENEMRHGKWIATLPKNGDDTKDKRVLKELYFENGVLTKTNKY